MLEFTLPSSDGIEFKLSDCQNPLILFFYPRDNTPGCTIENQDFARLHPEFAKAGYKVVGISRDTIKSHCKFAEKLALPFALLADPEEAVCAQFKVMKAKKMYGKDVRGIERSTFIIDSNKNILKEWRNVKVEGHAQEVLEFIQTLA
ncbi:MAG: peroxiredoxin [Burkholderiales bacterium]|jgi:peroxiredoxin Q/BCP